MNWNLVWVGWFIVTIGLFAVLEWLSISKGKATLSRFIWNGFMKWPLTAAFLGMLFGGLLVHFFWHWCPPGSVSGG